MPDPDFLSGDTLGLAHLSQHEAAVFSICNDDAAGKSLDLPPI